MDGFTKEPVKIFIDNNGLLNWRKGITYLIVSRQNVSDKISLCQEVMAGRHDRMSICVFK